MDEILRLYRELRDLFGENDLRVGFRQKIHRIVQETIDQIPVGTRIAIRPAGGDTKKLLRLYDFSKKNIIGIVSPSDHGGDFCGYRCFTVDSFSAESCDCVIITSFRYRQEIKAELEASHIPYIDFYDELEKQGIQLNNPFYLYELFLQLVVNHFYLRYLRSEAGPQRETALRELLQIAVECKDITLISNIYLDCGGEDGEFPLLKTVWAKSKQLLDCIQNKLQERKQKDIVLFWTDAVPYDMLRYLPETVKLSKQGTFFQRAYANAPGTNTAMIAMFRNILPIDNFSQSREKISSQNSPLIQFMENKGYKVRVIGDSTLPMRKEHLLEVSEWMPCNMTWWEGIVDLLQSPEPCFYVFCFQESHLPCFVPDFNEPDNPDQSTRMRHEVHIKAAYRYLDQCLPLYHKLLGNKTQIFFSDHGSGPLSDKFWMELMLHHYCFVVGENVPKKTVTRFLPQTNFEKLVQWLADPVHFSLDDACTDEVIFQNIDYYDPDAFNEFIKEGNARKGIAYRGILNYDYKYVINALGEEYFYQMQQDGTEKLILLEDSVLRNELRDRIGSKFLDIDQYDEFHYTKKMYEYIKLTES